MLRRTSSSQSPPSTLARTNSDSISIKKNPFNNRDSFGLPFKSSEENNLKTEKITVNSPKRKNSKFSKSPSKSKTGNFQLTKGSSKSLKRLKTRKSLKVFDENKIEIYIKPILRNKNLNKVFRPIFNLNVTEYEGKKIKFLDQVDNINKPFVEILKVESYRIYNQEISHTNNGVARKKFKEECGCKCLIF